MSVLKRFSGYFRSDNSLSLIGNLVFAFFGFANIFLLARSYPKDDFGEWVIYLSGMAFVEMIRKGMTSTPLVRAIAGSDNQQERQEIIGASWILSSGITLMIILVFIPVWFLFSDPIAAKGFGLFFQWYPVLAIVILPLNTGLSVLQADRRFGPILNLRFVNMFLFFVFLILNYFWFRLDILYVVWAHILAHLIASAYTMMRRWSGILSVRLASAKAIRSQMQYGKFSLGTLIGSNLLKSSDTFIIGIMLTEPQVAYYSIPLKLIEIVEIPIRSFVSVAFPKMSQASRKGDHDTVRSVFYRYTGMVSLLFLPLTVMLFFLAQPLTLLLGGAEYVDTVWIFRIFLIYALLLPLDRFSGISLDAINRPDLNMIKVFLMATANIVGDVLVIWLTGSLEAVAMVTILNVIIGVVFGNYLLSRQLNTKVVRVIPTGFRELQTFVKKLTSA